MKYIVYAFNYPTLCRALRYIDSQWGKENSILIFAELVSPLPEAIKEEYKCIVIKSHNQKKRGGIVGLYSECMVTLDSWKALKYTISQIVGEFTFVVFRDNEIQEATLIERLVKHYNYQSHVWIIEEGIGLYRNDRNSIRGSTLKRFVYSFLGLSLYALENISQGVHPKIEKVICGQPNIAANKFSVPIEKQIDIFTPNFCKRFVSYVLGNISTECCHFDYVFLTTPILDILQNDHESLQLYNDFLKSFISVVSSQGSLLIKSHPRDHYDYSAFNTTNHVKICTSAENSIPFECLYEHFGRPQIISMGSSVSLTLGCNKPPIFVERLLGQASSTALIIDNHLDTQPIVCNNFEDLAHAISQKISQM